MRLIKSQIIEKIKSVPKPKPRKFDSKQVTINFARNVVANRQMFTVLSTNPKSPLYIRGNAEEVSAMFGCWLKNTLNSMELNKCDRLIITAEAITAEVPNQ